MPPKVPMPDALALPTKAEEACLDFVRGRAVAGDAEGVLSAMDEFARRKIWMMNVGDGKGPMLDAEVRRVRPLRALELGAYAGYSAVRIARLLPPGGRLTSVEIHPGFAQVTREMLQHAGLGARCDVIVGSSRDVIQQQLQGQVFDLVFLDHWKDLYAGDVEALIAGGCLRKGSVVVADNVIFPGAPEYLKWVRGHTQFRSRHASANVEYSTGEFNKDRDFGAVPRQLGKVINKGMKDGLEFSEYLGGAKL